MKYSICKIVLWLKDDKNRRRELVFEENKINIITGESGTGKTAILHIIDYCYFASKHKIAESMINEHTDWYGINFKINDKHYTLARKAPEKSKVSDTYYFSSTGEIPDTPTKNINESSLKDILEPEFCIDKKLTIPFGGESLKANTKISLRYFLLFTTISGDIIQHSEVFFDKQNEKRYREALPRVFDLAIGIETIENILKKEKKSSLISELKKIEKKNSRVSEKVSEFQDELNEVVGQAKEYGLVPESENTHASIDFLKTAIDRGIDKAFQSNKNRLDEIRSEIGFLERRIRNLKRFQTEYGNYKSSLNIVEDSLKPVKYWTENNELVRTSIFEKLVSSLEEDLSIIRKTIHNKTPVDGKLSDEITLCESQIQRLEEEEKQLPKNAKSFSDERDKLIFLGQTKARLDLYQPNDDNLSIESTEELESKISSIQVLDTTETREMCIKVLEEIIQGYMDIVKPSLENYGDYHPVFNYKEKKIDFRKPKSTHIEASGSSSNDMFKHLFMFLGLHELMLSNKTDKHVPAFLIIDQPSRPYYGEEKDITKERLPHSDKAKVIDAFKLLDSFLGNVLDRLDASFQMIIFEHAPASYFVGFENIHLLEEFRDGNALVPQDYLDSIQE